jgi:hypothetical protein
MQSVTTSLRLLTHTPSTARASVVRTLATAASPSSPLSWSPASRRTGVLARKHGMTCIWHEDGSRIPVTVLEVRPHLHLQLFPLLRPGAGRVERRNSKELVSTRESGRRRAVNKSRLILLLFLVETARRRPGRFLPVLPRYQDRPRTSLRYRRLLSPASKDDQRRHAGTVSERRSRPENEGGRVRGYCGCARTSRCVEHPLYFILASGVDPSFD